MYRIAMHVSFASLEVQIYWGEGAVMIIFLSPPTFKPQPLLLAQGYLHSHCSMSPAQFSKYLPSSGGGRITFAEQSWVENDLRVQKGNSIMRWWWTALVLKMPMIYSGSKVGPQRKFGCEPKKIIYSFSLSGLFCLYFMRNQCICFKHTVEMWSQRWLLNWCVYQEQAQQPSPGPGDPPWPGFCPPFLPPILQLPAFHLSSTVELHHTCAQKDPLVSNILCFSSPWDK